MVNKFHKRPTPNYLQSYQFISSFTPNYLPSYQFISNFNDECSRGGGSTIWLMGLERRNDVIISWFQQETKFQFPSLIMICNFVFLYRISNAANNNNFSFFFCYHLNYFTLWKTTFLNCIENPWSSHISCSIF